MLRGPRANLLCEIPQGATPFPQRLWEIATDSVAAFQHIRAFRKYGLNDWYDIKAPRPRLNKTKPDGSPSGADADDAPPQTDMPPPDPVA